MKARPLRLAVQVVPNAGKSEVAGMAEGVLRIRLKAQPIEGRANEELVRFLAARLKLPRSAVAIVQGASSRRKLVEVQAGPGMSQEQVLALLLGDQA